MHIDNRLLPDHQFNLIQNDELRSSRYIDEILTALEEQQCNVDVKLTGRCIVILSNHQNMKYDLNIPLKSRVLNIFMSLVLTGQLATTMKTKLMECMQTVIEMVGPKSDFTLPWLTLWQEVICHVTRSKKHISMGSEHVLSAYVVAMINFLHATRDYVPKQDEQAIVDLAMTSLRNILQPQAVEGLVLLVTCLPVSCTLYDEYLPEWLQIWGSVQFNAYWDCCWSTLFVRARKHSRSFAWSNMRSAITSKTRQLLQFQTVRDQNQDFPYSFPQCYRIVFGQQDARKTAIRKMAKLMYFMTVAPAQCSSPLGLLVSDGGKVSVHGVELVMGEPSTVTPPALPLGALQVPLPGFNTKTMVRPEAVELALFLQSVRPYFNPSNNGNWSPNLASLLTGLLNEISHHVAKSIAHRAYGGEQATNSGSGTGTGSLRGVDDDVFARPMHVMTVRFIIGSVLALLMESLYSKSNVMMHSCALSVRNILALDSGFGSVLMPFLIAALDPAAVNQSHQAPAAMYTLSICFKPLLFPNPLIIGMLPDLMTLALPGLDANDVMKTSMTIRMLNGIFAWLPVRSDYSDYRLSSEDNANVAYLDMTLNTDNCNSACAVSGATRQKSSPNSDEFRAQMEVLGTHWAQWLPLLFEKVCSMLAAQEEQKKGTRQNPLVASISQLFGYLFQALDQKDSELTRSFETRVLNYLSKCNLIHAAKIAGKIVENMLSAHRSLFSSVIEKFLDEDVINCNCSAEKLTFRLRMIAGACRFAGGECCGGLAHDGLLKKVLLSPAFATHKEKSVRKAAHKLLKDLLRGMSSSYPINLSPIWSTSPDSRVLGAPTCVGREHVSWYVPNETALVATVAILRQTVDAAMQNIREVLVTSAPDTDTAVVAGAGGGRASEVLLHNFACIQKALRGSAESLGDGDWWSSDGVSESDGLQSYAAARNNVISTTLVNHPEDKEYLLNIRHRILQFLSDSYVALQACDASRPSPESPTADIENTSNSTATTNAIATPNVLKAWSKVLNVLVVQRMAWLKTVESVARMFDMSLSLSISAVNKIMTKIVARRVADGKSLEHHQGGLSVMPVHMQRVFSTEHGWKGHDMNTNEVMYLGWLQHAKRLKLFANYTVRATLRSTAEGPLLRQVMTQLIGLCQHNYDVIRTKSHKIFSNLSATFGWEIKEFLARLISTVSRTDSSYGVVRGSLSLLQQANSIRRIRGDAELLEAFLIALTQSQGMLSSMEQLDKRELLARKLADVYSSYLKVWSVLPMTSGAGSVLTVAFNAINREDAMITTEDDAQDDEDDMAMVVAETVQVAIADEGANATSTAVVSKEMTAEKVPTVASIGIRHHTLVAFTLLHLIGNQSVVVPGSVWAWCVQLLSQSHTHGQPVQHIALAALTRLVFEKYVVNCSSRTSQPTVSQNAAFGSFADATVWAKLLHGISHCHPKVSDDGTSSQWSHGIDNVLQSTKYLQQVFPRALSGVNDSVFYSERFQSNMAGLFMSVLGSGLMKGDVTAGQTSFPLSSAALVSVRGLLAAAVSLTSSSEEEFKANISVRAEVFAGLYKAWKDDVQPFATSAEEMSLCQELEKLLVDFLVDNVSSVSLDGSSEWAEAVYFSCRHSGSHSEALLTAQVMARLRSSLASRAASPVPVSSTASSSPSPLCSEELSGVAEIEMTTTTTQSSGVHNSSGSNGSNEGFSDQAKLLVLARSLLQSDISACILHRVATSHVASEFVSLLLDRQSTIVSPFRVVRSELSAILGTLQAFGFATPDQIGSLIDKMIATGSEEVNTNTATAGSSSAESMQVLSKPAVETCAGWVQSVMHFATLSSLPLSSLDGIIRVLEIVLMGCSHAEVEFAGRCHKYMTSITYNLTSDMSMRSDEHGASSGSGCSDCLHRVLHLFKTHASHNSRHIRETVSICAAILMTTNWFVLSNDEKKVCKDMFVEALHDSRPEVQLLAQAAVTGYLGFKPSSELASIAAVYTKNNEAYAVRYRKRGAGGEEKHSKGVSTSSSSSSVAAPDKQFVTTVTMSSCLIQCFPYDLPNYLPKLLLSMLKHLDSHASLHDTVAKSVQAFKRTHQDKWQQEFQKHFTREQLEDLQGAGAAHYFA